MSSTYKSATSFSRIRSGLTQGAVGVVLIGSVLIGATPTGASSPSRHPAALSHVAHWLSRTPHGVSPRVIHQTFVVDSSFDPIFDPAGCASHHAAGSCTLRNAIYAASHDGSHVDAVTIPSGRHLNIYTPLNLSAPIVINGAGAFLNANGIQAFYVTGTTTITGLNISGGTASSGGAIDCESGSLVLSGVNINHSSATSDGGAIYQARSCNLWIDNSTFSSNTAGNYGGALYLIGNANISRSTFGGGSFALANIAPSGAAIYNQDGAVILNTVTVKHNMGKVGSVSDGVGIYNDESMDITNSSISYNAAPSGGNGAGIENQYNLTISNSFINSNTITGGTGIDKGAGIYNDAYVLNLSNITMTANAVHQSTSTIDGAALYTNGGTTTWNGGSISATQAINSNGSISGGAVCVDSSSENVILNGISISSTHTSAPNHYIYGGALYLDAPGNLTNVHVSNTLVSAGNITGGAIDNEADWAMSGLSITGTNAHASSSGAYIDGGAMYLDDYTVLNSVSITNTTAISDLGGTTFSGTETDVYGGVLDNASNLSATNLNISGATVIARGGTGVVHGGAIYNTDLATYNKTQVLGLNVTADYNTPGGLIFSNDHFQATGFTLGNSTVSVNPHHTSASTPYGQGTILGSDGLSTDGKYNFINATFSNITTSVTTGSYNWGFLLYNNAEFSNSTLANLHVSGPGGTGNTVVVGSEASSNVTFHNSIVSSAKPWQNCFGYAPITSSGYSIDNGSTCHFNGLGDQSNSSPKVLSLANNGGTILTAAFTVPGSSALNKGTNVACPAVDARGVARPQGGICDVGAYEYVKPKR
jgi:hypothetical protein